MNSIQFENITSVILKILSKSELENLTHTIAQNRLNNECFVSMFSTANVLEFASQTLIIYRA